MLAQLVGGWEPVEGGRRRGGRRGVRRGVKRGGGHKGGQKGGGRRLLIEGQGSEDDTWQKCEQLEAKSLKFKNKMDEI